MKILYFHQHFSTPKGSTGIRSYEMGKRLLHHGHDVTMVCGSYGGGNTGITSKFKSGKREGIIDGIHVIEFNLNYSNHDTFLTRTTTFIKFAMKSIGIALTAKYDIVFATTTPLTAGIPGIFAKVIRRKPFVFEVRDLWPELPREMKVITNPIILGAMGVLEWMSYKSATRLIGLSPGIKKGIERLNISEPKVKLVPNGCDLNLFKNASSPWRPQSIPSDKFMAVFTGTHGLANGLDAVLDAAKVLQDQKNDAIQFLLIGQGRLKTDLEKRVKNENINNVHFHDPVDKEKLSGLMASADIGMQILANIPAFYFGTSPNKFFDYIASGLPVINNYPGWLAEMIEDNKLGYSVSPENPEEFASALIHAESNRSELKAMGERSKIFAKEKFLRQDLADKWVAWVVGAKS
jgi:glycosyltransferase involved in cell wall biosynthesis